MISADRVLSEQQLSKLLKIIKVEKEKSILAVQGSSKRNPKEVRNIIDYFLFRIISVTGLRISEALTLRWSDVHTEFLVIQKQNSKNGRKGTVYFGDKASSLFDELRRLKSETIKRGNPDLVFSFTGIVPSRSYAHSRFKKWLSLAGLPLQLSIHSLRHTYATLCLDKGLSLAFVKNNLRHQSVASTSAYLHLTQESRQKIKSLF